VLKSSSLRGKVLFQLPSLLEFPMMNTNILEIIEVAGKSSGLGEVVNHSIEHQLSVFKGSKIVICSSTRMYKC